MFLWLRLLGVADSSALVKERAIKAKVRGFSAPSDSSYPYCDSSYP
jgi:hypothetical protein